MKTRFLSSAEKSDNYSSRNRSRLFRK